MWQFVYAFTLAPDSMSIIFFILSFIFRFAFALPVLTAAATKTCVDRTRHIKILYNINNIISSKCKFEWESESERQRESATKGQFIKSPSIGCIFPIGESCRLLGQRVQPNEADNLLIKCTLAHVYGPPNNTRRLGQLNFQLSAKIVAQAEVKF